MQGLLVWSIDLCVEQRKQFSPVYCSKLIMHGSAECQALILTLENVLSCGLDVIPFLMLLIIMLHLN
jgi:hypothetical protein